MNAKDDQKQNITEVANMLFRLHGFKSITMDAVAKEGHISKKTIYKYFSNKESLIEHILTEWKLEVKKMTALVINQAKNSLESCFFIYYCIFGQTSGNIALIHWTLKNYYSECYEQFYNSLWLILKETTVSIFNDGIRNGLIIPEVEPGETCYILINSLLNITNRTQVIKDEFDAEKLIKKTIYYALRSISTPSGLEILSQIETNDMNLKTLKYSE